MVLPSWSSIWTLSPFSLSASSVKGTNLPSEKTETDAKPLSVSSVSLVPLAMVGLPSLLYVSVPSSLAVRVSASATAAANGLMSEGFISSFVPSSTISVSVSTDTLGLSISPSMEIVPCTSEPSTGFLAVTCSPDFSVTLSDSFNSLTCSS